MHESCNIIVESGLAVRPKIELLNHALNRPSSLEQLPRDPRKIWLDKNENFDPNLTLIFKEILKVINPISFSVYPEMGPLYKKIAHLNKLDPSCVFLAPGSDGIIKMAFEAFISPGDPIIYTEPSFAMYEVYSQIFGASAHKIEYRFLNHAPSIDIEEFIEKIRFIKPKLVCLPNPDSPTGTMISKNKLETIIKECSKVGAVFLLDEAYYPFSGDTGIDFINLYENVIIARTFSKAWGGAGIRVGYGLADKKLTSLMQKIKPMYEIGALSAEIVLRLLEYETEVIKSVQRVNYTKQYFQNEIKNLGFQTYESYGNFAHVNFGENSSRIHNELEKYILYKKSFNHNCLSGYCRFSIASFDTMQKTLDIIKMSKESS